MLNSRPVGELQQITIATCANRLEPALRCSMSTIESVKVAVRVRPFNDREKEAGSQCIVRMKGAVTTLINPETQEERDFAFDFSYWSHDGFETDEAGYNAKVEGSSKYGADYASQQTVYDNLGAPMLENVMAGYNSTMFAYGQTGAGKSYSFVGYGANKGILPIVSNQIFEKVRAGQSERHVFQISCSYMEVRRDIAEI